MEWDVPWRLFRMGTARRWGQAGPVEESKETASWRREAIKPAPGKVRRTVTGWSRWPHCRPEEPSVEEEVALEKRE